MANERCRLISESQWREYQEFKADKRVLDEQISNLQNMVESECSKRCELENALSSQADYFRQQISVLEDRLKEAENIILLYFKNTQNATYQSLGMNDGYYKKAFMHTVAKEYLEKYKVEE